MAKPKDLRPQIEEIIKKHEEPFLRAQEWATKREDKGDAYAEDLRKEFYRARAHLLGDENDPIDEEDARLLKYKITDELALTDKRVPEYDWWWTEPSAWGHDLLAEVKRSLDKATPEKGSWVQKLGYVWKVLMQFVYLALVLGVFSVATTKFETVIIAIMVLTYNATRGARSGVGFSLSYQMSALQGIYGDLGRALKMAIPTRPEIDAKQVVQTELTYNLIQGIPLALGSLFAVWKIADALMF